MKVILTYKKQFSLILFIIILGFGGMYSMGMWEYDPHSVATIVDQYNKPLDLDNLENRMDEEAQHKIDLLQQIDLAYSGKNDKVTSYIAGWKDVQTEESLLKKSLAFVTANEKPLVLASFSGLPTFMIILTLVVMIFSVGLVVGWILRLEENKELLLVVEE